VQIQEETDFEGFMKKKVLPASRSFSNQYDAIILSTHRAHQLS
jgi:hypothetical protein